MTDTPSYHKTRLLAMLLILAGAGGSFAAGRWAGRLQLERERHLAQNVSSAALEALGGAFPPEPLLVPITNGLSSYITLSARAVAVPVPKAIAELLRGWDRVDVLVNLAGRFPDESKEQLRVSHQEQLATSYTLCDVLVLAVEENYLLLELTTEELNWIAVALPRARNQSEDLLTFEILPRHSHDAGFRDKSITFLEKYLNNYNLMNFVNDYHFKHKSYGIGYPRGWTPRKYTDTPLYLQSEKKPQ
jgi:hypothetical protein